MTRRKPFLSLWILFGFQSFCALFFGFDAIIDFLGFEEASGYRRFEAFEYMVSLALIVGVVLTYREIRHAAGRQKRLADQVRIASGQFTDLLQEHFDDWGLTEAERDVAILSIKGLSVAEIAAARSVKEGTVKAQNAALYRKAGVSGRLQLLSLFIDELMEPEAADEAA